VPLPEESRKPKENLHREDRGGTGTGGLATGRGGEGASFGLFNTLRAASKALRPFSCCWSHNRAPQGLLVLGVNHRVMARVADRGIELLLVAGSACAPV